MPSPGQTEPAWGPQRKGQAAQSQPRRVQVQGLGMEITPPNQSSEKGQHRQRKSGLRGGRRRLAGAAVTRRVWTLTEARSRAAQARVSGLGGETNGVVVKGSGTD